MPVLFLLVPVAHIGALVAFSVLPDWSTGFLISSVALWLLGLIWIILRSIRQRRVPVLVVVWLALATLLVIALFIGMMAFVFPGWP